jgi:DNA-binding transcriptional MerR regulator
VALTATETSVPPLPPTAAPTATPPAAPTFTIAEVAEQVGVTAHTLRYYERIGLLDIGRDAGGRRRYTEADIGRVVFITKLRAADLPISRIQHYFALVAAGDHTAPERVALLERHRDDVLARLASLEGALAAIDLKLAVYATSPTGCVPPPADH